ncbi:MAG: hypothetical protein AB8H79_07950 [Myxococcota bacterium]
MMNLDLPAQLTVPIRSIQAAGASALLVAGLACGGLGTSAASTPPDPVPPSSTEAAVPQHFKDLPGYLAFATARRDVRVHPWTPVYDGARVAIINSSNAWFDVAEGKPFIGVAKEGTLDLTYSTQSETPYGWDDVPTVMTGFNVPKDLAEQPVWILPDNTGGARYASAFSPKPTKPGRWTVGPFTVDVELTPTGGTTTVTTSKGGSASQPWTTPTSPDIEPTKASLSDPLSMGVPRPLGAFRLPDDRIVLILRSVIPSGFRVDIIGGTPQEIGIVGRRDLILGSP